MNDDVSALRATIPAYAGHADVAARRLSDQQVRAWAGEALIDLQERLAIGTLSERFEKLLLRCEFGDQHVIRALEGEASGDASVAAAIEAEDRKVVDVAARGPSVATDGVEAFVGALEHAFDERAAMVTARLKR